MVDVRSLCRHQIICITDSLEHALVPASCESWKKLQVRPYYPANFLCSMLATERGCASYGKLEDQKCNLVVWCPRTHVCTGDFMFLCNMDQLNQLFRNTGPLVPTFHIIKLLLYKRDSFIANICPTPLEPTPCSISQMQCWKVAVSLKEIYFDSPKINPNMYIWISMCLPSWPLFFLPLNPPCLRIARVCKGAVCVAALFVSDV